MDGTLLDAHGNLPPDFSELHERAESLGCTLVPASGRQLATLKWMFPHVGTFIAENGAVVMHQGEVIATFPLPAETVHSVRETSAAITQPHTLVLCGSETAYVRKDVSAAARAEIAKYYKSVTWVDSLEGVPDTGIIKIAMYCEAGSEAHLLAPVSAAVGFDNIAVSGAVWLDVMAAGVDKGEALAALARLSDVPLSRTAAFGDFLNDYELLQRAGLAIAMDNAHPSLKEIADIIAPPNTEYGVSTVLRELFAKADD